VRTATKVLEVLLILVGLGVLLSAALLWMALRRWVLLPMVALGDEIDQVASGDVGHRVDVVGPPDVERLAEQVDAMRVRVVEEYAEALSARHAAEQAQEMLEEQAAELRRSNTELEQFAYVASHDLQEPLRKVASFCQMLERRYAGQLDERADQYIAFAVDGAKRMQRLINDLLAFSRVGRLTNAMTRVELADALAQALRSLETAREETGAVVTSDPLPAVHGDPTLLAQLFQNLIANGIKFSGGQTPRVHIGAERDGDFWVLSCTDNGIGIEPRYAERIFVIFQRLHAKDEYEGTGIGLSMCRKIVEYHGGRMWLDEERAERGLRGTRFVWTLPVLSADAGGSDAVGEGTIGRVSGDDEEREHADA
jgi:light-regulated signal transduction histidine kinase (bacteriophytochrome)